MGWRRSVKVMFVTVTEKVALIRKTVKKQDLGETSKWGGRGKRRFKSAALAGLKATRKRPAVLPIPPPPPVRSTRKGRAEYPSSPRFLQSVRTFQPSVLNGSRSTKPP